MNRELFGMNYWSAIVRWDRPSAEEIRVRIPCGDLARAKWLRGALHVGGCVDEGTVVLRGRRIRMGLAKLGYGPAVLLALEAWEKARPGIGKPLGPVERRALREAADRVFSILEKG